MGNGGGNGASGSGKYSALENGKNNGGNNDGNNPATPRITADNRAVDTSAPLPLQGLDLAKVITKAIPLPYCTPSVPLKVYVDGSGLDPLDVTGWCYEGEYDR